MDAAPLTSVLKTKARELGFGMVGICPAVESPGARRLDAWLESGYAGGMHYLADRREAYDHPRAVLDGARSVVMLAMHYRTVESVAAEAGQGRVSRYAWGTADYHDVIRGRLDTLAGIVREHVPGAMVRGVVDTAPLMEREFAQLAGLGWIGKNTLLLNPQAGSWFFLAALLTDVHLEYDVPFEADHCGSCRACLDACPTDAFPQPYVLDASRCISYLTIESKDSIPASLRGGVGDWVFGCDVCQEVCPWNARAPQSSEAAFEPLPHGNPLDLIDLFELDEAAFRARFRQTPLWRPKRRGLLRNAAIALGNRPTPKALPALRKGLADPEPLVRAASAWALGQFQTAAARADLAQRRSIETDREVIAELDAALEQTAACG